MRCACAAWRSSGRKDAPLRLGVDEIAVDKAYARVIVTPEGKINLAQLKFATTDDPSPAPAEPPKPRDVRIGRIVFADSRLNFSDHFIRPNYTADVGELHGSVGELSSARESRGVVDLEGRYDQTSPVTIAGTINPLSGDLFLDIAAKGKDIELPKLSAYSQRYAGYGITQGKLTLDVKYHVEDGKLQGRNNILLDQLVFGEKVESPEATKLPVLFAVNLLKDSKGAINVELPITGSLQDPQFEIGGLITQLVVVSSRRRSRRRSRSSRRRSGVPATRRRTARPAATTSPSSISTREATRSAQGLKKLDAVAKALLDRPAIRIEMTSRVDAEKDLQALKQAALARKVTEAKGGAVYARRVPALSEARVRALRQPEARGAEGRPAARTVRGRDGDTPARAHRDRPRGPQRARAAPLRARAWLPRGERAAARRAGPHRRRSRDAGGQVEREPRGFCAQVRARP
jgi:hypothetical protein